MKIWGRYSGFQCQVEIWQSLTAYGCYLAVCNWKGTFFISSVVGLHNIWPAGCVRLWLTMRSVMTFRNNIYSLNKFSITNMNKNKQRSSVTDRLPFGRLFLKHSLRTWPPNTSSLLLKIDVVPLVKFSKWLGNTQIWATSSHCSS